MAIWFTSDTHFGHTNIIKYSDRPFANVTDMDDAIINNINAVVRPADILYHLGDFSFRDQERYRNRINCHNIILILGNHDKDIKRHPIRFQSLFSIHPMGLEIKVDNQDITLCHYAMRVWNHSHHGAWHLYGHSHGSLPDDACSLSFDVGVDCWDCKPVSLDDVRQRMMTKSFKPIDHHGQRKFETRV